MIKFLSSLLLLLTVSCLVTNIEGFAIIRGAKHNRVDSLSSSKPGESLVILPANNERNAEYIGCHETEDGDDAIVYSRRQAVREGFYSVASSALFAATAVSMTTPTAALADIYDDQRKEREA